MNIIVGPVAISCSYLRRKFEINPVNVKSICVYCKSVILCIRCRSGYEYNF